MRAYENVSCLCFNSFCNFVNGFFKIVEETLVHRPFVRIGCLLDDGPEVNHDGVAVGQNLFEVVVLGQVRFVQVVLTCALDDLVVDVGDVHHVEDVVSEIVLENSENPNFTFVNIYFVKYHR